MRIEHFGGSTEIQNEARLNEVLNERFGNDANEFLIAGDDRYPLLSILVCGSVSCLHFFPFEDHPGFLSVGANAAFGVLTFYTNTPTEKIEVEAEAVVPFDEAREAAKQFLNSGVMPKNIRWREL